jgi:hypothetical protein
MYNIHEEILLDIARIEREARAAVLAKIAGRQLGEAWKGLPGVYYSDENSDRRGSAS